MKYDELVDKSIVAKTASALRKKGYQVIRAKTGAKALEVIKETIPGKSTVMNGSSVTLEQIGYQDYLNAGKHGWVDLRSKITSEKNDAKRMELRRQSSLSDYYLGSVHALTEDGEFVIASNTASQLPHIVYTSPNLIFVVSTKKIVPNMNEAIKRLEKFVVPLEDKHMEELFGSGTQLNKILIFKGESSYSTRKITFILVEENLGF